MPGIVLEIDDVVEFLARLDEPFILEARRAYLLIRIDRRNNVRVVVSVIAVAVDIRRSSAFALAFAFTFATIVIVRVRHGRGFLLVFRCVALAGFGEASRNEALRVAFQDSR